MFILLLPKRSEGIAAASGSPAWLASRSPPYGLRTESIELDFLTATLNQNDQQNYGDNSGNYPDDRCIVHVSSPFLLAFPIS